MKQLIPFISVSFLGLFFVGCAESCFYQAGKSIEQCERDLVECAYSVRGIDSCMQARGYEHLQASKLPHRAERRRVTVRFEEHKALGGRRVLSEAYWIMDGLDPTSAGGRPLLGKAAQDSDPNSPPRKLIGYKARKDDSDKFIFIPVYEDWMEKGNGHEKTRFFGTVD